MGVTISVAHEVVLGRYVMLARNVYISDHRHAYEDVDVPINEQGIADIRPTSIGDETWLGHNACVLPGVHIGRHCVIGANSTVTRDIPDYCVAVGSPARVVKVYDFREKRWTSCAHATDHTDGERIDLCGSTPDLDSVI
jgi:acetyltransferase-like isoleucine patch superfamily enzyme